MRIALERLERSNSMNTKKLRWVRKAAALTLAALALLLPAVSARSDSGGEADVCKRALLNCLGKSFSGGGGLDQLGVLFRLEYCLAGFDFCRKYVALYI
jgi:hypothetical protein